MVNIETVRNFVNENLIDNVMEGDYFICTDSRCHIAYFNLSKKIVFNNNEINTPIWYKAKPRYACYCNKATIEEVKEAI